MQEQNKKDVFHKDYFTEYYMPFTGDFTQADLVRNKNWFYGWFKKLNRIFDFDSGKGKKALEIGCSIGAAAQILHERGFEVVATDISEYAIEKAKKLLPHLTFDILDVDLEPPAKYLNQFDVIYAFEVIEHLENPEKCINNMYKMLAPGGTLICSTPYPYKYVFFDKTHINVRFPYEWVVAFRQSKFKIINYIQRGFVPYFYRFSKYFHITLPFGVNTKYINSPVFVYGKK